MGIVNYESRKSNLSKSICEWFLKNRLENLSFGAILDKYCEIGMSRKYVANLLTKMTKGEIKIKDTTLWEAWKSEVVQGRCDFVFKSKFSGNQFHGNKGKIKNYITSFNPNQKGKVFVAYVCLSCRHKESKEVATTESPRHLIALKAHKCKVCGKFGTSVGRFKIKETTVYKAIVENTEHFIRSEGSKIIPIELEEIINS